MSIVTGNNREDAFIRSEEEFNRAHRKAFLQDMFNKISGHNLNLLSFAEVVDKLRLHDSVHLGLKEIPLNQIAGSCGRYTDFTKTFYPRRGGRDKERWRHIYTLATTGKGFPPIDVYKIDRVYFVKDGNHRVSVARELNWKTIQANVTELPTVFTLEPGMGPDQLLIKEECAIFLEQTRLHELRPEADIVFTEAGRYRRLLKQIAVHQYILSEKGKKEMSLDEVVIDWYDNVYQPIIAQIQASGVMKLFPNRTADDLAAWLVDHQKQLSLSHKMDEAGYVDSIDDLLSYIDNLKPWDIAKIEVEDKLKGIFNKGEA